MSDRIYEVKVLDGPRGPVRLAVCEGNTVSLTDDHGHGVVLSKKGLEELHLGLMELADLMDMVD